MYESFVSCRFLEYGEYKGNLYGTSIESAKEVLNSRKICVIDVEPNVRTTICLSKNAAEQLSWACQTNRWRCKANPKAMLANQAHEKKALPATSNVCSGVCEVGVLDFIAVTSEVHSDASVPPGQQVAIKSTIFQTRRNIIINRNNSVEICWNVILFMKSWG